ncbi:hypothetical protein AMECASPLE_030049, partial [Ameca splendens]
MKICPLTTSVGLNVRSPAELEAEIQRANVSLQANRHNSSNWIQECHTITSKLCSREFPAETLSLRRRVEQFPGLKERQQDRITVVTAATCSSAGRQNEPPPQLL